MKKMHYGWVICITCTLPLFVTMGTVSNGFSVYLPYIMEEKGAHQRPDLLPGHPAVRGVLSVHAGHRVLLPEGSPSGWAPPSPRLAAGVSFLLYSAAEAYPLFCVGAAISG